MLCKKCFSFNLFFLFLKYWVLLWFILDEGFFFFVINNFMVKYIFFLKLFRKLSRKYIFYGGNFVKK